MTFHSPGLAAGHLVTALLDTASKFFHLFQLNFTLLISGQCFQGGTGFLAGQGLSHPSGHSHNFWGSPPQGIVPFYSFIQQAFIAYPSDTPYSARHWVSEVEAWFTV